MAFAPRPLFEWKLRTRSLALGRRTEIMGVVNVTPDSFSDGGRYWERQAAVEGALSMLEEGAAIVDLGGESTRPGEREPVSAAEEIDRVVPVIEAVVKHRPEAILSVDTYKAATAQAALQAGAEIVNDVSGLLWDPAMAGICASAGCGLVLVHTRGRPAEWRSLPRLSGGEVMPLVESGLNRQLGVALSAGIARERIVLDPGFGFGKIGASNYVLLAELERLRGLGQPLLAGLSRKSFLGRTLASLYGGEDAPVEARERASLAAAVAALLAGAHILRAHDVRHTLEAASIGDAVLNGADVPEDEGRSRSYP
jgi:dihydropteroate synthase